MQNLDYCYVENSRLPPSHHINILGMFLIYPKIHIIFIDFSFVHTNVWQNIVSSLRHIPVMKILVLKYPVLIMSAYSLRLMFYKFFETLLPFNSLPSTYYRHYLWLYIYILDYIALHLTSISMNCITLQYNNNNNNKRFN